MDLTPSGGDAVEGVTVVSKLATRPGVTDIAVSLATGRLAVSHADGRGRLSTHKTFTLPYRTVFKRLNSYILSLVNHQSMHALTYLPQLIRKLSVVYDVCVGVDIRP